MNKLEKKKELHIFYKNLSFPIIVYVFDDWEKCQVKVLVQKSKEIKLTTFDICCWCDNHQMKYDVIFPRNVWKLFISDIRRFKCYLYLKKKNVSCDVLHSIEDLY